MIYDLIFVAMIISYFFLLIKSIITSSKNMKDLKINFILEIMSILIFVVAIITPLSDGLFFIIAYGILVFSIIIKKVKYNIS